MRPPTAGLLLIAAATVAPVVRGAEIEWFAPPTVDPLRMASLPLDAAPARELAAGRWAVATTVSSFNVWSGSWHTGTIHRELGRTGGPLERDELRLLELRHPADEIYRVDLEGWRADLEVAVGLGRTLTLAARLPRYGVGTPHWDGLAQWFHDTFGFKSGDEEWFARGQSVIYVRGPGGTIEAWEELETTGWGDASLTLAGSGGRWAGGHHRWAVAVEAPTGREGTIAGSGGWDLGVRWFSTWGRGRHRRRLAAGITWPDSDGRLLGARRSRTWHLLGELYRPLSRRLDLRVNARLDASPLAGLTGIDPGEWSFFLTVGVGAPLGGDAWLAFDVGENYPIKGVAPDFTFHLQVGTVLGSGGR